MKIRDAYCDGKFGESKDLKGSLIIYHHKNKIAIKTRLNYLLETEFPDNNIYDIIKMDYMINKWCKRTDVSILE